MKLFIAFTGIILLMYACNVKSDIPQEQNQQPINNAGFEVNKADTSNSSNDLDDNLKDQTKITTTDDITFKYISGVDDNFKYYLNFTFTNNTNRLVTAVKLKFRYRHSYDEVDIKIRIPPLSSQMKKHIDISSESIESITILQYISRNRVYSNSINAFFEKTEDDLKKNPAYNN